MMVDLPGIDSCPSRWRHVRSSARCSAGLLALLALLWSGIRPASATPSGCPVEGVGLQVLGSGGPELTDKRASSGYLLWVDGRARVLVDLGPGSLQQFERSGARLEDIQAVALTHLHVDHSADLPALVKGSFFTDRNHDLPVYGPTGNRLMPDTTAFVQGLFGEHADVYRYLSDYLSGEEAYRLVAHNVPADDREIHTVLEQPGLRLSGVAVHHGPIPALAWRVEVGDRVVVFSGDMNGDYHTLERLAARADLLVAHNAVPEGAVGVARNLHMPPSVIGRIAGEAGVSRLVLSHRMRRTLGREAESTRAIRRHYDGALDFADDGQCFRP